eukprot:COSAG02_NODE_4821_length_4938_cov_7.356760_3_plen_63_part_00
MSVLIWNRYVYARTPRRAAELPQQVHRRDCHRTPSEPTQAAAARVRGGKPERDEHARLAMTE